MEFVKLTEPNLEKPLIVAAMQDMGNVGSIVIDFLNKKMSSTPFRYVTSDKPPYVIDTGGYIEVPNEKWEYRYADSMIIFGGGAGQPQSNNDLNDLCQDVIDTAIKYSARFIYTVGGFHTTRDYGKDPSVYVTTTSRELVETVKRLGISTTPQSSVITGFNGLILGYAKMNRIQGIGMYGEISNPRMPQYRTAKKILMTLEKLTYQKFGDFSELDSMADAADDEFSTRSV